MNDYFDQEIKMLNREILQLKTSVQKSAGVMPIVSKTVTVDIPLVLHVAEIGPSTCSGRVDFLVDAAGNSPVMATLNKYFDDITKSQGWPYKTRQGMITLGARQDGRIGVAVVARGDETDVAHMESGASITLTYQLTIRALNDFTIERA